MISGGGVMEIWGGDGDGEQANEESCEETIWGNEMEDGATEERREV
jgi:hypothetical protein